MPRPPPAASSSSRATASAAPSSATSRRRPSATAAARTEVLDLGLTLAALLLRDLACLAAGADSAVLAVDRREQLASMALGRDERTLRAGVELCEETRASLELNVSEELALSALGFPLRRRPGVAA